jgi:ribosomal protein S18 acetylase RimI-like enzyme
MPASVPLSYARNPAPRLPEVRPLEPVEVDAAASASIISRKWDTTEVQRRVQILHYFNTIPGKFTLNEAQITTHSQAEYAALPNDMKEAVRNAVVGWHWDYDLGDPLPAAHIVFGLGRYTLSQAGELAIQTFSLMPADLRTKLVDGYSIWDDLKARGEHAVSGLSIQSAISQAATHARRNYTMWRRAWEAMTAEEKAHYFRVVQVCPRVTHITHTGLVGRPFNDLPDEVKAYLYDHQQPSEIEAKVKIGKNQYYIDRNIRIILDPQHVEGWPASRINDFIELVERNWNGMNNEGRTNTLRFILDNDPYLFTRHGDISHFSAYRGDQIEGLSLLKLYELSNSLTNAALGHLALYFMWVGARHFQLPALTYLLVGLDAYVEIIPTSEAPRESPERMSRIATVSEWMNNTLRMDEGRSYNEWVKSAKGWIAKLAYHSSQMTPLTEAGRVIQTRVQQAEELRRRARFQVGQQVRVQGIANVCKVSGISENTRETVLYNIVVAQITSPGDPVPVTNIADVQESKLSAWAPWPLEQVLNGVLWNDGMGLDNRGHWLTKMNNTRMSSDVTGTAAVNIYAARTWEGLGPQFRKKLAVFFVMGGIIEGLPWADYAESWRLMSRDVRIPRILFAMSLKDPLNQPLLEPSNTANIFTSSEENNLVDLPLAYIYGIALSELGEEEELKHYKLAYENLHARYQAANEEDAIYYGIGAGIEPQIAVSTVRPVRYPIAKMTDWKAFKLVEKFKKVIDAENAWEADEAVLDGIFHGIVNAGRRQTPELPRVSALDELNTAWGTAHYQDRYMVVVGAIGRDAVLEQYAGNGYQPPATYIQAASARDVNTIRDTVILQTLVREFEAASRNMAPLQQRGGETLRFIAESLNSARREGAEAAGDRTRAQWDALPNYLRAYVMKYARDEGLTTSAPRPTYGPWESMTPAEKAMLLNIPDWDLAKKYGAAKQLETLWAVGSAPARQHWILGLGTTILEAEFHAVMTSEWSEYSRIPARFTQALIEAMVSGVGGHYGPEALGIIADRGTNIDPERMISSSVVPLGQVHVGDFVKVTAHGQERYGFVALKESELRDAPQLIGADQLLGNWGDSFMEAYNQGSGITVEAVREDMAGAERDMMSGITEAEISGIVRYEQNYPLPILNDGWGRAPGGAAEASMLIRIGRLCGMMLLGGGDVPERLLAHLYPEERVLSTTLYEHSIWSAFPPEMRSLLVWSQLHSELYERDERYLSTLVRELGSAQRVLLDDWLMALGGNVLVVQFRQSNIEDWLTIWLPILAFAYRKVMERASPPAGTRPLPLTLMDAPAAVAPSRETIIGLPGIVPPTPVRPAPARPPRVMESTIRRAWAHSAPHERMAVLRAMDIPMEVARPFISTPFSHLTVALKRRIKRARRDGIWEIRDERMAVAARPAVPPTPATPARPSRISLTTIKLAWTDTPRDGRRIALESMGVSPAMAQRQSGRTWRDLPGTQRARIMDAVRETRQHLLGRLQIIGGRIYPVGAIAPSATPAELGIGIGARRPVAPAPPPPEAPTSPQEAWDRITPAQRRPLLRHFDLAHRTGELTWNRLNSVTRQDMTAAWRRGEWGLSGPSGAVWIHAPEVPATPPPTPAVTPPVKPPAPVPTPTPTAIMMRAWDALPPPRRVHVLQATVPEISTAQARTRSLMPFGVLDHETQSALQEAWDQGLWIARGLRPVTPAPPPTPAPSGEEFFQDPFRQAIRDTMAEDVWDWPRAQLDVTAAERTTIAGMLREITNWMTDVPNGGHGVPVPYILLALNPELVQNAETRVPNIRGLRVWQRIKGAVRHRGGRAVVSLQVGEFYKSGKWWRENTVKWRRKKKGARSRIYLPFQSVTNPEEAGEAPTAKKGQVVEAFYSITGNWFDGKLLTDPYIENGKWKARIEDRKGDPCTAEWNGRYFVVRSSANPKTAVVFVFPTFAGDFQPNPEPAQFQMVPFRSDVYPIKVINDFLQRHAEGWVTSFQRHYNLDRLPANKRVYIAISTDPADKPKPLLDKIIGVLGITRNQWDNIDDVFIAVHTGYRRMGVGRQMAAQLVDIARRWVNPETGRGARRIYLLVKDANKPSNLMFQAAGFTMVEQFLSQPTPEGGGGVLVNRYMRQLYEPPRENTEARP